MKSKISLSLEMKEKLKELGNKGESYEQIISRMYEMTKRNLLINYLSDETDSITIKEAKRRLN